MRLDGVGVVQWQSLASLSKLGRIHIAGYCESALPRAPWYTIHLSVADIQNKVEQTPLPIYRNHKLRASGRLCLASIVPPPVPNLRCILLAASPQLFSAHVEFT